MENKGVLKLGQLVSNLCAFLLVMHARTQFQSIERGINCLFRKVVFVETNISL